MYVYMYNYLYEIKIAKNCVYLVLFLDVLYVYKYFYAKY